MPEKEIEPNVRDLKAWLLQRPRLYNLFISDHEIGKRILTAFDFFRISSWPDEEAFALIEAAVSAYIARPEDGIQRLDDWIDGIIGRFKEKDAEVNRNLAKQEAVKYLRPGDFENFLLQSDEQFSPTVRRLAGIAFLMPLPDKRKDPETFTYEVVSSAGSLLKLLAEGKMDIDSKTNVAFRTVPIGELLNAEQREQLRVYVEMKRPRIKEILLQVLPTKK